MNKQHLKTLDLSTNEKVVQYLLEAPTLYLKIDEVDETNEVFIHLKNAGLIDINLDYSWTVKYDFKMHWVYPDNKTSDIANFRRGTTIRFDQHSIDFLYRKGIYNE